MNVNNFNFRVEDNGEVIISSDRTRLTIRPDGTVVIASSDPVQLAGQTLSRLHAIADRMQHASIPDVVEALAKRSK